MRHKIRYDAGSWKKFAKILGSKQGLSLYKKSKFMFKMQIIFLLSITSNMEFKFRILIIETFNIQNHESTPVKKW
jgi:hypothetical protein